MKPSEHQWLAAAPLRSFLLVIVIAAGTFVGNAYGIPPTETIRVQPLHGSRVATAGASGHGTAVVLDLHALAPWGRVRVLLDAGTCAHAGASFAEIVTVKPNPKGALHATDASTSTAGLWTSARSRTARTCLASLAARVSSPAA